eukprot:TRINITY_DN2959_c0_g1_i1.p1 TRINITY_DN2959_c0_g1~~TRINITY_DN2959_c0_g1_i1.p1  ORF type:complete len:500 (+),score=38.64 TRINITY_DN2959_c0_g1_i1:68-1567(+)
MSAVIVYLLVIAALYWLYFILRDIRKPLWSYWSLLPVIGDMPELVANIGDIRDYQRRKWKQNGSPTTWFWQRNPPYRGWGTTDPKNIEHILKTNFSNYSITPIRGDVFHDFIGNGIFNSDGDLWKLQRKTASYEFSNNKFRHWFQGRFVAHAEHLLSSLEDASASKQPIEMQNAFANCTLDSVCEILFGIDLTTYPKSEREKIALAFNNATGSTVLRFLYPANSWRLVRWLNIWSEKTMSDSMKVLNGLCGSVIAERKKLSAAEMENRNDLLSRFVAVSNEAVDPYLKSEPFIRDMIMSLFLAGRDTTSNCLSWLFYVLSSRPDIADKVSEEIKANIPEGESPTFDALKGMYYTHAVVTETLRLYPSVPEDPKVAQADDVLPSGGHKVQKGDVVAFHPNIMGISKELWGEDAEDFKPERWLDEKGEFVRQSPYKFTAFQAGPRQCLGLDMAYLEVKTVLVMILQHGYRLKLVPGQKIVARIDLTLPMANGMNMMVEKVE